MSVRVGNLFRDAPPEDGERFDELATLSGARVERIVSSHSPGADVYDQAEDEWVVLLDGEATLEVAGNVIPLQAGDHVFIPRRTPHRVLSTSHGARWLAVHGAPASK